MFLTPASSHVVATAPLAWALQNAGHAVVVASQPEAVEMIKAAGLVATPLKAGLDLMETTAEPAAITEQMMSSLDLNDADDVITFERADVAALQRRWDAATLVTNPPYGERLKPEALGGLYRSMARTFERLSGWRVVVLSGSPLWAREMRRKPAVSHKLFNGPLEVRLLCYDVPSR